MSQMITWPIEDIIKEQMLCVVQKWSRYTSTTPSTGVGNMEVVDHLENVQLWFTVFL